MKRFTFFIFIVIVLTGGAIAFTIPEKGTVTYDTSIAYNKQTHTSQQTTHFILAHSLISGQEILRNIHAFQIQQASFRTFSSLHNDFRLRNFNQLTHQQYLVGQFTYIRKAAFRQYEGYYLYHLCKLLI